ncbi:MULTISPECIES: hypothetical protein [Gammaproteobacteria]|uniref:hypothetical protein n=1 Tax=Acinetobacter sp. HRXRD-152 TaxID=3404808 RepID=UPI003BB58DA0
MTQSLEYIYTLEYRIYSSTGKSNIIIQYVKKRTVYEDSLFKDSFVYTEMISEVEELEIEHESDDIYIEPISFLKEGDGLDKYDSPVNIKSAIDLFHNNISKLVLQNSHSITSQDMVNMKMDELYTRLFKVKRMSYLVWSR